MRTPDDPTGDSGGFPALAPNPCSPPTRPAHADPQELPVAVVTGAAQGIGAAIAMRMAAAGYRLAVTAETDLLAEVADRLGGLGLLAHAQVTDLGVPGQIEELIADTVAATGRVDVLVNNAGVTLARPIETTTAMEFGQVVSVNLAAAWGAVRAAVPVMRAAGGGTVVNVSSIHASWSQPGHSVYAATKGALSAVTRQLAVELAPDKIRVNAVEPGLIDVARTHRACTSPGVSAAIPAGRAGRPGEVAEAVTWLAGPHSPYITGVVVQVDGGLSARLRLDGSSALWRDV